MIRRITVEVLTDSDHFRFEIPEDAADVRVSSYEYREPQRSITYRAPDSKDRVTCTVELL